MRGAAVKLVVVGFLLPAAALAAGWLAFSVPAQDDLGGGTLRQPQLVAHDSSGHEHDGVIQGAPTLGLSGHAGTAYSFDNRGSWVQVPSTQDLNPGSGDFLFSAWVNFSAPPSKTQTYDIIRKGLSFTAGGEFKVEIIFGGRVKCSAKDAAGHEDWVIAADSHVVDGRWHRIGCARTGTAWSVIVDDIRATKRVPFGEIGNALPLSIGSKYGREDLPQGRVDEVRLVIADSAGSSATRLRTGAAIKRLDSLAPTGWWRLDEPPSAQGD